MSTPPDHAEWWRTGVVYQVYPRSFQDSNGDGIGDLKGIASRLDYLVDLGVDAVWVSPFYPSPMVDFGYDVADYCGVDPMFGTLEDFEALLAGAHARGLKLIIDYVPNHTSDQHPWFQEALQGGERRDWYIWRDPAPDGGPPTNWLSVFGGPAWTFEPLSGQYYLHSFLTQQPDLNWRNPAVEQAMFEVLRFWLDRGVDGFRMDVLWYLIKDDQFRHNPANPAYRPGEHPPHLTLDPVFNSDRPETLQIVRRMRALLDSYAGDRVLIGETYLPVARLAAWYGERLDAAHMPFNFKLLQTPWEAPEVEAIVRRYEAALPEGAQRNWVMGNHDNPRLATRFGHAAARAAAVLLLTLRGTPTLYYGEELGLGDAAIPPERVQDPREHNQPGMGRDPERTPMPWTGAPGGGFSAAEAWLPIPEAHLAQSVEAQLPDPASMQSLYRRLLRLRRAEPALHAGGFEELALEGEVLRFERVHEGTRLLVAVNFSDRAQSLAAEGELMLSTDVSRADGSVAKRWELAPHEALILRVQGGGA